MAVSAVSILDDFQPRQLVWITGVGTGQVPRTVLHADAEDCNILMMLGDAEPVGRGKLAVDQIYHALVVAVISAELEMRFGVIAISGLDDAELPPILAQNFVGVEADRISNPHYLEGAAVGAVDVGARPRLVVRANAPVVGIVGAVRIVVVRDLLLAFVLPILLLVFFAILLLVLNVTNRKRYERKRLVSEIIVDAM